MLVKAAKANIDTTVLNILSCIIVDFAIIIYLIKNFGYNRPQNEIAHFLQHSRDEIEGNHSLILMGQALEPEDVIQLPNCLHTRQDQIRMGRDKTCRYHKKRQSEVVG